MKTIMFQGNSYNVPDWAKWVARDQNNTLVAFENKPVKSIAGGHWIDMALGKWENVLYSVEMVCEEIP